MVHGFFLVFLLFSVGESQSYMGSGSATACAGGSLNIPITAQGSFSIVNVIAPRGSFVVQTKPGTAWDFTFWGDASRLRQVTFSSQFVQSGVLTLVGADSNPPVPSASAASALNPTISALCIALLAVAFVTKSVVSPAQLFLAFAALLPIAALAVPQVLYYCGRGTLVVTYPAGGQVLVNGLRTPTCSALNATTLQTVVPYNINVMLKANTFWFSSPVVYDVDLSPPSELIACSYDCRLYNFTAAKTLTLAQTMAAAGARVYAPPCVADFDGNNRTDLCYAAGTALYCWEWQNTTRTFVQRSGFPVTLSINGEIRGMSCGDLNFDGSIDIALSTTDSRVQTFVYNINGQLLQGWPRYNTKTGATDDADPDNNVFNGINSFGHYRYGSYGLNVGIANMDDDPYPELMSSFDNHQIQLFKFNGVGVDVSNHYRQVRSNNNAKGQNITWGQMTPRWTFLQTDEYLWNALANGTCYPNPLNVSGACTAGGDEWLQFTQSPMGGNDLEGDGKNEALSIPNTERGACCGGSYVTLKRVAFVIDGAYGNYGNPLVSNTTSGMRHSNGGVWDAAYPPQGKGINCPQCYTNAGCGTCRVQGFYPPETVPAVAVGDLDKSGKLSVVAGFGDGTVNAFDYQGRLLWRVDFAQQLTVNTAVTALESSEPVIADLNQDGVPEILFTTYGVPTKPNPMDSANYQNLFIVSNTGVVLQTLSLTSVFLGGGAVGDGNGDGAAGAPTVADIDGDGQLEIICHTFDGRILIFTVPGSAPNCLLWPTARGGYLRKGQPDYPTTQ